MASRFGLWSYLRSGFEVNRAGPWRVFWLSVIEPHVESVVESAASGRRMSGIRVVVVSDRRLSCLALAGAVDAVPGTHVVAQVSEVADAKDWCQRGEADAVLVDASVLVRTGLTDQSPGPPQAGALTATPSLSAPVAALSDSSGGWSLTPDGLATLTPREREVFVLLGTGLSNGHMSKLLGVSQATVKSHVGRVLAKLDLESRLQAGLAAVALCAGSPLEGQVQGSSPPETFLALKSFAKPAGGEQQQRAAQHGEPTADEPTGRVVRARD